MGQKTQNGSSKRPSKPASDQRSNQSPKTGSKAQLASDKKTNQSPENGIAENGIAAGRAGVVTLIYPGVTLLDACGPAQAFATANRALERRGRAPRYEVVMASLAGGPVATDTGVTLGTLSLAEAAARPMDTVIVAGGDGVFNLAEEVRIVYWVRAAARTCRRVASSCMGAFVTGKAGLLDGRRVTTHWRHLEELQRDHPASRVEGDPLFVKDGNVWSSAGCTAGIDMALAMIEEDLGHEIAMDIAQALVVFLKRPGGQSQFSNVLIAQGHNGAGGPGGVRGRHFGELQAWVAENLMADLSVEALAERAGMSPRNFSRLYKTATGLSPAKSMECLRVEGAKRLLEQSHLSVAQVAAQTGLGDEQRLRRAFLRHSGVTPAEYRRKFGASSQHPQVGEAFV
ncbi:MAG: GlxA family transcriptional regulator [Pseudomonadota bacterium]